MDQLNLIYGIAGLGVGFAVGTLIVFLAKASQISNLATKETVAREKQLAAENDLKSVRADLEKMQKGFQEEQIKNAARVGELTTKLQSQSKSHGEKVAALTAIRAEIEKDLKVLAGEALKSNQTSFLELAKQSFDKHKESATADLEKRQEAIANLLKPIGTTLEEYKKNLGEIEKSRQEAYGNLSKELETVIRTQTEVRSETSKLVNALRAAPKTRGRWGEETLKNVMQMSGMSPFCDFTTEKSIEVEGGMLRPDVILRLPGDRFVVIDAKTSTSAYMDAVEAVDDAEREAHLTTHAKQLRTHMVQLASKAYHDALRVTPDFVAMFIPGDNFFSAAMERDPELFEDAVAKGVLIVTPTTLIALAKAIAYGWRQEKVAENANKVAELGRDLYRRISVMGGHIAALGKTLDSTVGKYNDFVGSLEGSVMPQARRFNELEVEGTAKALPDLVPIEKDLRELRTGGEIKVVEAPEENETSSELDRETS